MRFPAVSERKKKKFKSLKKKAPIKFQYNTSQACTREKMMECKNRKEKKTETCGILFLFSCFSFFFYKISHFLVEKLWPNLHSYCFSCIYIYIYTDIFIGLALAFIYFIDWNILEDLIRTDALFTGFFFSLSLTRPSRVDVVSAVWLIGRTTWKVSWLYKLLRGIMCLHCFW